MVARVLQPLGMAAFGRGDRKAARDYLAEGVELARQMGDKRELAAALTGLAQIHRVEGLLEPAEPLYDHAVALAREIGDRESVAIGLLNLAMVSIGRGVGERAAGMLREVIAIAAETGSKQVGQCALDVSAGLGAWCGEWEQAALYFGAAQAQVDETGLKRDPADEAFLLPLIGRAREELGPSAFEQAERLGRGRSYDEAIDEARSWLMRAS